VRPTATANQREICSWYAAQLEPGVVRYTRRYTSMGHATIASIGGVQHPGSSSVNERA